MQMVTAATALVFSALLSWPALAGCHYETTGDYSRVDDDASGAGYDVTLSDGSKDHCTDESAGPGTMARIATCDGGWSGVTFTAASTLDGPNDQGILVLMNMVWYKVCAPTDMGLGN